MPSLSKTKSRTSMSTSSLISAGRIFCVTGTKKQPQSVTSNLIGCSNESTKTSGQSDSDASTSGYLSTSSFESSGEERLLVPSGQMVFNVRTKLGEQLQLPATSTPKQDSETASYKKLARRVNISNDSGRSLLSIKKSFNDSQKKHVPSIPNENKLEDSFWDIETPRVLRRYSESNVRKTKKIDNEWKRKSVEVPIAHAHDAGQDKINFQTMAAKKSQNLKRRPFLSMSDSQLNRRLDSSSSAGNTLTGRSITYSALPRYRVKIDEDPVIIKNNLARKLYEYTADFSDTNVPVDESMSEFLSNVDRENLAGFLNFYDRMTSTPKYEKARRNPKNYEAVYY